MNSSRCFIMEKPCSVFFFLYDSYLYQLTFYEDYANSLCCMSLCCGFNVKSIK